MHSRLAPLAAAAAVALCCAHAIGEDEKSPPEGAAAEEKPAAPFAGDGPFATWKRGAKALRRRDGSVKRLKAVHAGLDWLARHQDENGLWRGAYFPQHCGEVVCSGRGVDRHDLGVTALATLAFLGAGEPKDSGAFEETVTKALDHIVGEQHEDGVFGDRRNGRWIYDHIISTWALTEAYGLGGAERYRESAQRGVKLLHEAQNPYLAWRYGMRDGDNDTSVTCWALVTLRVAQEAGLEVDGASFRGGCAWLDIMTEPEFGVVGYQDRGGPSVRSAGKLDGYDPAEVATLTHMATAARLFSGQPPDDMIVALSRKHSESKGISGWRLREAEECDFIGWQFGSLAAFQTGGSSWKAWNGTLEGALMSAQVTDRKSCERGSWFVEDAWSEYGGRIQTTALALLSLETHIRYPRFSDRR